MSLTEPPTPWTDRLALISSADARRVLTGLFQRAVADARMLASEGHEVVVVLVSRRLSCLYEMLVGAGFDDLAAIPGCTVISDRALEGSVLLTPRHRILLIDDAIVLGTTLVDAYDGLVDALVEALDGPYDETTIREHIWVRVAMVDEDRHSDALLDRLGLPQAATESVCFLPTKELRQVALDIARCLYQAGRPYFTDFPLVDEMLLPPEAWERLLSTERWAVFDVTPPSDFAGPDRRSITFIPRAAVEQAVRSRGRQEAMELVEGIKVRAYAGPPDEAGNVPVRIVPMGLPGAMMVPRLRVTLEAIQDEIGVGIAWMRWKAPALHRLLQMYTSSCVLAEFWQDLRDAGYKHDLTSDHLDSVHIGCYFGEDDVPHVLGAFDRAVERYSNTKAEELFTPEVEVPLIPGSSLASNRSVKKWTVGNARMVVAVEALRSDERYRERVELLANAVPPSPGPGVTSVDRWWVHRVLNIFGEVDEKLELPQEAEIRDLSYAEYADFRERSRRGEIEERVVKMGITLRELSNAFAPLTAGDPDWAFAALSLAIDVGNDMGVIVPTTVCREPDGPVFRQYRSGEMAYATRRPHAELRGISPDDLDAAADEYTAMVIRDLGRDLRDPAKAKVLFVEANDPTARIARPAELIAQSWIGNVTTVSDDAFEAYVSSRLDPGLSGPVIFRRSELPDGDADAIDLGDTVLWTVFSERDELDEPLSTAEVRRLTHNG